MTEKKTTPPETSFYAKVLDEAEKLNLETASGIEGIDQEIAVLRVQIRAILQDNPRNFKDIVAAANALEKLVKTRYHITKEQRKGLKEAIGNVVKDIALPLGIGVTIGKQLK